MALLDNTFQDRVRNIANSNQVWYAEIVRFLQAYRYHRYSGRLPTARLISKAVPVDVYVEHFKETVGKSGVSATSTSPSMDKWIMFRAGDLPPADTWAGAGSWLHSSIRSRKPAFNGHGG